jgi:hypothetical protein
VSNPITTSGLTGPDISTSQQSGQSTQDWVVKHSTSLDDAEPDGDKLTTTWTSAAGPEEVSTERLTGETDEHFLARHELAYATSMISAPPVP